MRWSGPPRTSLSEPSSTASLSACAKISYNNLSLSAPIVPNPGALRAERSDSALRVQQRPSAPSQGDYLRGTADTSRETNNRPQISAAISKGTNMH
eukprot:319265-Prorocentrum_minimum.AAC.2